jgi:hypothetical protein
MYAIQKIESEISACQDKIREMIIKREELQTTDWTCGHEDMLPGEEHVAPDPCDTCPARYEVEVTKLSRQLSNKDLLTVQSNPVQSELLRIQSFIVFWQPH